MDLLIIALLVGFILLYLPGFIVNKALHFDTLLSFLTAPMVSCLLIIIVGFILYLIPVYLGAIVLFASVLGVSLIVLLISAFNSRKRSTEIAKSANIMSRLPSSMTLYSMMGVQNKFSNWAMMILYVLVAFAMTAYMYLGNVDFTTATPSIFAQNASFSEISNLSQSGVFSCLIGMPSSETGEMVVEYNSLWQIIPAIISNLTGLDSSTCINAVFALLCIFVVPLGMFSLLSVVFYKNRLLVAIGSVFTVSFGLFPWYLLLLSNQAGSFISLSLVPYILVAILGLTIQRSNRQSKLVYIFLIIASIVSIIVSYANVILAVFVMCVPYLISRYFSWVNDFGKFDNNVLAKIMGVIACIATTLLLWIVGSNIPVVVPETVNQNPISDGLLNAFINVFTLALVPAAGSQLMLGIIIVCGALIMIFRRGYRWLVSTWAICVLMYIMSVILPEDALRYALGFWYIDLNLISAFVCLAAVPLAAAFSSIIIRACTNAICTFTSLNQSKTILAIVGIVYLLGFASVNLLVKSTTYYDDQASGNTIHVVKDGIHSEYAIVDENAATDAQAINSDNSASDNKKSSDSKKSKKSSQKSTKKSTKSSSSKK